MADEEAVSFNRSSARLTDCINEKEMIESIDASYFIDEGFDAVDYEMQKFSSADYLGIDDAESERERLKSQLHVISRKISALIVVKAPSYSIQREDIVEMKNELGQIIRRIKVARSYIKYCMERNARSLALVANYKRRKRLLQLCAVLRHIRTLQLSIFEIHGLVENNGFPSAIRLCHHALEAAKQLSHLRCVEGMTGVLADCSAEIESALDSSLASLVLFFDSDKFVLLHSAYALLGRVQAGSERLISLLMLAMEGKARQVVSGFAHDSSLPSTTYVQLLQSLSTESALAACAPLATSLCHILLNAHRVLAVLSEEMERDGLISLPSAPSQSLSSSSPSQLSHRLLLTSLSSLFHSASSLFNLLLSSHDFSSRNLDDLLSLIMTTTKFDLFGRVHFGYCGDELRLSLEKHCEGFFTRYHDEKMDELRMFLENDEFAPCPLPASFSLFQLQEFSFLREKIGGGMNELGGRVEGEKEGLSGSATEPRVVLLPLHAPNPFTPLSVETDEVALPKSGDEPVERDKSEKNEEKENEKNSSPVLCNSALVVMRVLGGYIRMASLLPSISPLAINAIIELFQYFFFSLLSFFSENEVSTAVNASRHSWLSSLEDSGRAAPRISSSLSSQLQLADSLFALAPRIVAIQSLEFASRQLELTRPVIESLLFTIDKTFAEKLHLFYCNVVMTAGEAGKAMLKGVAERGIKRQLILSSIASTRWQLTDIQSHHSSCVDVILQELEVFSLRREEVSKLVDIPPTLSDLLSQMIVHCIVHSLVQGYGRVGSGCSAEGRALMLLDVQQLAPHLESFLGCKPSQHLSFVDAYIKAYYLPETTLEAWVVEHKEYSREDILGLLAATSHVSRKTKTRLLNSLPA